MNDNVLLRHIRALLYGILSILVIIAYAIIMTSMMPETVRCIVLVLIALVSGVFTVAALRSMFSSDGH